MHLSYYCQDKYVSWSYLSLSFTPKLQKFHIQTQTLDFLNVFPVAISGGGQFLYSAQKHALKMQLFNLHILSKFSLNKYFEGQTIKLKNRQRQTKVFQKMPTGLHIKVDQITQL